MTEITTVTYRALDGREFDNEEEAYKYENNLIYKNSGFKFCLDGKLLTDLETAYDLCDCIVVDPVEGDWNKMLLDVLENYYGFCVPNICEDGEEAYIFDWDKGDWERVERKFLKFPEGAKDA